MDLMAAFKEKTEVATQIPHDRIESFGVQAIARNKCIPLSSLLSIRCELISQTRW